MPATQTPPTTSTAERLAAYLTHAAAFGSAVLALAWIY